MALVWRWKCSLAIPAGCFRALAEASPQNLLTERPCASWEETLHSLSDQQALWMFTQAGKPNRSHQYAVCCCINLWCVGALYTMQFCLPPLQGSGGLGMVRRPSKTGLKSVNRISLLTIERRWLITEIAAVLCCHERGGEGEEGGILHSSCVVLTKLNQIRQRQHTLSDSSYHVKHIAKGCYG